MGSLTPLTEVNRLNSQLGVIIDDYVTSILHVQAENKKKTIKMPTLGGGISNKAPSSSKVMLL